MSDIRPSACPLAAPGQPLERGNHLTCDHFLLSHAVDHSYWARGHSLQFKVLPSYMSSFKYLNHKSYLWYHAIILIWLRLQSDGGVGFGDHHRKDCYEPASHKVWCMNGTIIMKKALRIAQHWIPSGNAKLALSLPVFFLSVLLTLSHRTHQQRHRSL